MASLNPFALIPETWRSGVFLVCLMLMIVAGRGVQWANRKMRSAARAGEKTTVKRPAELTSASDGRDVRTKLDALGEDGRKWFRWSLTIDFVLLTCIAGSVGLAGLWASAQLPSSPWLRELGTVMSWTVCFAALADVGENSTLLWIERAKSGDPVVDALLVVGAFCTKAKMLTAVPAAYALGGAVAYLWRRC